jgi:hypothetical protein
VSARAKFWLFLTAAALLAAVMVLGAHHTAHHRGPAPSHSSRAASPRPGDPGSPAYQWGPGRIRVRPAGDPGPAFLAGGAW